jgi:hypothetical protein
MDLASVAESQVEMDFLEQELADGTAESVDLAEETADALVESLFACALAACKADTEELALKHLHKFQACMATALGAGVDPELIATADRLCKGPQMFISEPCVDTGVVDALASVWHHHGSGTEGLCRAAFRATVAVYIAHAVVKQAGRFVINQLPATAFACNTHFDWMEQAAQTNKNINKVTKTASSATCWATLGWTNKDRIHLGIIPDMAAYIESGAVVARTDPTDQSFVSARVSDAIKHISVSNKRAMEDVIDAMATVHAHGALHAVACVVCEQNEDSSTANTAFALFFGLLASSLELAAPVDAVGVIDAVAHTVVMVLCAPEPGELCAQLNGLSVKSADYSETWAAIQDILTEDAKHTLQKTALFMKHNVACNSWDAVKNSAVGKKARSKFMKYVTGMGAASAVNAHSMPLAASLRDMADGFSRGTLSKADLHASGLYMPSKHTSHLHDCIRTGGKIKVAPKREVAKAIKAAKGPILCVLAALVKGCVQSIATMPAEAADTVFLRHYIGLLQRYETTAESARRLSRKPPAGHAFTVGGFMYTSAGAEDSQVKVPFGMPATTPHVESYFASNEKVTNDAGDLMQHVMGLYTGIKNMSQARFKSVPRVSSATSTEFHASCCRCIDCRLPPRESRSAIAKKRPRVSYRGPMDTTYFGTPTYSVTPLHVENGSLICVIVVSTKQHRQVLEEESRKRRPPQAVTHTAYCENGSLFYFVQKSRVADFYRHVGGLDAALSKNKKDYMFDMMDSAYDSLTDNTFVPLALTGDKPRDMIDEINDAMVCSSAGRAVHTGFHPHGAAEIEASFDGDMDVCVRPVTFEGMQAALLVAHVAYDAHRKADDPELPSTLCYTIGSSVEMCRQVARQVSVALQESGGSQYSEYATALEKPAKLAALTH